MLCIVHEKSKSEQVWQASERFQVWCGLFCRNKLDKTGQSLKRTGSEALDVIYFKIFCIKAWKSLRLRIENCTSSEVWSKRFCKINHINSNSKLNLAYSDPWCHIFLGINDINSRIRTVGELLDRTSVWGEIGPMPTLRTKIWILEWRQPSRKKTMTSTKMTTPHETENLEK